MEEILKSWNEYIIETDVSLKIKIVNKKKGLGVAFPNDYISFVVYNTDSKFKEKISMEAGNYFSTSYSSIIISNNHIDEFLIERKSFLFSFFNKKHLFGYGHNNAKYFCAPVISNEIKIGIENSQILKFACNVRISLSKQKNKSEYRFNIRFDNVIYKKNDIKSLFKIGNQINRYVLLRTPISMVSPASRYLKDR